MDKTELIKYIDLNYSIYKLSKHFGKAYSTIRYWLNKYNLKTKTYTKHNIISLTKTCIKCNVNKCTSEFYINNKTHINTCKKCHNKKISYKCDFINYKGGKCEICNIVNDVCDIYDFHHKNPRIKEFSLSKNRYKKLTPSIKSELDKCHLLCSNCHREVHGGLHPNFIINVNKHKHIQYNDGKICTQCNIVKSFEQYYKYHKICKACYNLNNKNRRENVKKRCITYMGGCCKSCGYHKYHGALDFHHINSKTKEFSISSLGNKKYGKIYENELDKCICLCSNCHRIEHHRLNNI